MSEGTGLFFIVVTVLLFLLMRKVYERIRVPLLIPVATTTLVLIVFLFSASISYETYMVGGQWISELLGPAVVALAFPLYHQRDKIYRYRLPLFAGLCTGIGVGLTSGFLIVKSASLELIYSASYLPKSVTSPIAMDISAMTGGIPSLAAALVIISGIVGAVFGPLFFRTFRIHHYLGIGIGFGCASHGIGTAKAMEYGKEEAAFSSISMTLTAFAYAIILPITIHYLL